MTCLSANKTKNSTRKKYRSNKKYTTFLILQGKKTTLFGRCIYVIYLRFYIFINANAVSVHLKNTLKWTYCISEYEIISKKQHLAGERR